MLSRMLASQYAQFTALAEAWLSTGAHAFGIWRDDQPVAHWPDAELPQEAAIVAPIRVGDVTLGDLRVFGVSGFEVGMRLTADASLLARLFSLERALLNQLSLQRSAAAGEIERASRVHRDLLSAEVPIIADLDIFAAARPAMDVGGDFYDFISRPDQSLLFTIGDISGKGMSSALLMTMTRSALRSKASFMPEPAPENVLRNANADLYDDLARVGMFATAFVGRYEPGRRALIFANAGHAPVIYRPRDGAARLLYADNTALGILRGGVWQASELAIGPGDLLLLATDGLSDARGSDEEYFGIDRLLQAVDTLAHLPAKIIAETIFDIVDGFNAGREQDDDETLVVIKGRACDDTQPQFN